MSFILNRETASDIGAVTKLTGNTGGAVGPTAGNINVVGTGNVAVSGNPGTSTLTISVSGEIASSTTYVSTTPYMALTTDVTILVDTATIGAPSNIVLPDSLTSDGYTYTIKDWSGQASGAPITVNTVSSLSILDGATTFVLANNYESISFVWSLSESTYSVIAVVDPAFISLPATSSTAGYISINGSPAFQAPGDTNIFVGELSGNTSLSGADNSAIGYTSMTGLTSGSYNVALGSYALRLLQDGTVNTALGYQSCATLTSGSSNVGVGENSLLSLATGSYNIAMGQFGGANYTGAESSNIVLNHGGVASESNVMRLGGGTGTGDQQINATYISGITSTDLGTVGVVTNTGSSDQIGFAALTAGSGINITTGSQQIIISSTGGSSASTTAVTTTPYTVLTSDDILLVDVVAIGSAATILLPDSANDGEAWTVVNSTGSSSSNYSITVTTVDGATPIDGVTIGGFTFLMNGSPGQSCTFTYSVANTAYYVTSGIATSLSMDVTDTVGNGVITQANVPFIHSYDGSGNSNTFMGNNAGTVGSGITIGGSGSSNVGIGNQAFMANSGNGPTQASCLGNVSVGALSMQSIYSAAYNVAIGYDALNFIDSQGTTNNDYNIGIGWSAGSNWSGFSQNTSNIAINCSTTSNINDSNVLRIGDGTGTGTQQLKAAYISGIQGVDLSTTGVVTNTGSTDQLGFATLTQGSGISITTGSNEIIISSTGPSTSTTFINSSPYVVLTTDDVILVDTVTIGAPSTVELINAPTTDGQTWTIKDATGSAGSGNTITIQSVSGAVNIDGATTYVMNTDYQSVTVVWSASQSQYYII